MRYFSASLASLVSVILLALTPAVGAEVLARSSACGRDVRLERTGPGAELTLEGADGGPVALGVGDGTLESVSLPHGLALVATVRTASAPVAAAVVSCVVPGGVAVLWHGPTGWQGEDLGARTRDEVVVRAVDGRRTVVIGRRDEAVTLPGGQHPLVDVRVVDPATGRLVPGALDPLTEPGVTLPVGRSVVAEQGSDRPAVLPLRVLGTEADAAAVHDRDPATAVPLHRGTLVVFEVHADGVAARGVDLVPRPGTALPRRWTLLVDPGASRLDVEVPEALVHAARVHIPLAAGTPVRRVALVAGEAPPGAALGEVEIRTALDDPGVDPLAALAALASQPAGDDAAALLVELGDAGAAALAGALPAMTQPAAARRAVRLLGSVRRPAVAAALVTALDRPETAVAAAVALRVQGETALVPLAARVTTDPAAAAVIATVRAPAVARLRALVPALDAEPAVWDAARPAVAGLVREAMAGGQAEAWLAMLPEAPRPVSRGLALAAVEAREPAVAAAIAQRAQRGWEASVQFADRYRLLRPLAGDTEGRALLVRVALADEDADLRAEATRVLGEGRASEGVLQRALTDRTPRVRAAAARGLRAADGADAVLARVLAGDPWPTVRAAAAEALSQRTEGAQALLAALDQTSFLVVKAALRALGTVPGPTVTRRLVAFIDDGRNNPELRREAADALGVRCDPASAADLERLADGLSDPALPPFEQEVGHAVVASLARTDPARARAFVTRNQSNAAAGAAVEAAIRGGCRPTATPTEEHR